MGFDRSRVVQAWHEAVSIPVLPSRCTENGSASFKWKPCAECVLQPPPPQPCPRSAASGIPWELADLLNPLPFHQLPGGWGPVNIQASGGFALDSTGPEFPSDLTFPPPLGKARKQAPQPQLFQQDLLSLTPSLTGAWGCGGGAFFASRSSTAFFKPHSSHRGIRLGLVRL